MASIKDIEVKVTIKFDMAMKIIYFLLKKLYRK